MYLQYLLIILSIYMGSFYQNGASPDYVQDVMKKYMRGALLHFPNGYKMLSPINYI